jgi:glycosyltransferase involved in cell wall biosynthesis
MACGTPCVAFDIGGFSDMIDHKQTGYLAEPFSSTDITDGIEFILKADRLRQAESSKEKVASMFDIRDTVEAYREIYQELL